VIHLEDSQKKRGLGLSGGKNLACVGRTPCGRSLEEPPQGQELERETRFCKGPWVKYHNIIEKEDRVRGEPISKGEIGKGTVRGGKLQGPVATVPRMRNGLNQLSQRNRPKRTTDK